MVTIRIPNLWQPLTGTAQITVEAPSVEAALRVLAARCPALRARLFDAQGQLHGSLHVFVNQEAVHFRGGLAAALHDGDEIYIVPMLSGG
ncbi:MAG: MoaD/ThiS family protein [Anaerolineales bacterium]|nr:MoaD/ThiS family protein [Anaerolineales bacterium]